MTAPLAALIAGGLDVGDNVVLRAPAVGLWQPAVGARRMIRAGDLLGHLTVLGVVHRVIAPEGSRGIITAVAEGVDARRRVPVGHGALLFRIDPATELGASAEIPLPAFARPGGGLLFLAPTSGRFYSRPGPDKAPFVVAGDLVKDGQTVCMLEVMKTFNRVVYQGGQAGGGLPAEARVAEVLVQDEEDVDAGAPLLRLERTS